jgi:Spy/CpxP family protein refolding chaperone
MARNQIVALVTLLSLAGCRWTSAAEPKTQPAEPKTPRVEKRLDELAQKLNLSDRQKQEIDKIDKAFGEQAAPLRDQLGKLRSEEHEAMRRVLTEQQRAELPAALKKMWDPEWQAIGDALGLSDEQEQRIDKIREEYGKKFHDLGQQKGDDMPRRFRELRLQFLDAVRQELTDEQRTELPEVLREEFGRVHEGPALREHLEVLAQNLGLSNEQREQIRKIHNEYAARLDKEMAALRRLHREEFRAVNKVLTHEQRVQLRSLLRGERRIEDKQ